LPKDDPQRRQPVIGKAVGSLGWEPKVGIDKGLDATIAYFSLNIASSSREATVASIDSARAARARLSRRRRDARPQPVSNGHAEQDDMR
jgi:UDP-glucuronate decarboxylase